MADETINHSAQNQSDGVAKVQYNYAKRGIVSTLHSALQTSVPGYLFLSVCDSGTNVYGATTMQEAEVDTVMAAHDPAFLSADKRSIGAGESVDITAHLPYTEASTVVFTVEGNELQAQDLTITKRATITLNAEGIEDGALTIGVSGHPHKELEIEVVS